MKPKVKNEAGILLEAQLTELVGKYWDREHLFWPSRKWRFDYFLFNYDIAIEIEGGAWTNGRHTRGKGFIYDMEKYNHAALKGFKVLRFTPQDVLTGKAIDFIRKVLEA